MQKIFALIIMVTASITVESPLLAQMDTSFSYQGELNQNGGLATGSFNMIFSLWDARIGGNQLGQVTPLGGVQVVQGKFNVELDFGANVFDNSNRWLEISVDGFTLVPRTAITRSPYSIQTRGIFVNENNNVGMGTSAPSYPLHVESDVESAIFGLYTGTAGSKYGVYGRTDSMASTRGVFGFASAASGFTTGVQGRSNSTVGKGVSGFAASASGLNYGVFGETNSSEGYAGYFVGGRNYFEGNVGIGTQSPAHLLHVVADGGFAAIYGANIAGRGVHGESSNGTGVFGDAIGKSGGDTGVFGRSVGPSGRGVHGVADAKSGTNYGVYGESHSTNGYDFYASGAGQDYGSSSSIRWKQDVVSIDKPLEKLSRLRGVYFDWDADHGGHHDVGMIAEEVGAVLPEIVNYEENGIDAQGMDYSKLTPLLVEAVNALRSEKDAEIARQQVEIVNLVNRLDQMEATLKRLVEK